MLPLETPGRPSVLSFSRLGRAIFIAALVLVCAFPLGFLWFVAQVSGSEVKLTRNADGIVVLTGGASRVNDAFELLASKRGRRLLISGVYPATNQGELSRVLPEYERLFACCVDLDRTAVNTLGNAIGTRRWVEAQGFKSVIVVTSAYHMPRAVLAFESAGVRFVPAPTDYRACRGRYDILGFTPSFGCLAESCQAIREYAGLVWYRLRP